MCVATDAKWSTYHIPSSEGVAWLHGNHYACAVFRCLPECTCDLQACNIAYTVHPFISIISYSLLTTTMPRSDRWLQGMWPICSRLMFSLVLQCLSSKIAGFWRVTSAVLEGPSVCGGCRAEQIFFQETPNTCHGFTLPWSDCTGDKIRPGMQTVRCSFPRTQIYDTFFFWSCICQQIFLLFALAFNRHIFFADFSKGCCMYRLWWVDYKKQLKHLASPGSTFPSSGTAPWPLAFCSSIHLQKAFI